jgi:nitrate/nitrite-specific signal transduction histidine kinase
MSEALLAKMRASEKELGLYRLKLEEKVQERTVDLEKSQTALRSLLEDVKEVQKEVEEKNRVLQRFNKVMVGRELRMVELKNEIRKLTAQPGQDAAAAG